MQNSAVRSLHHPWVDRWCTLAEQVLRGREAETLLEDFESIPESGFLVMLPAWVWKVPAIDTGRKAINPEGGSYALPVRVSTAPLSVLTQLPADLEWSAMGMGHNLSGVVHARPGEVRRVDLEKAVLESPRQSRTMLRHEIQAQVEAGKAAWWELLFMAEEPVRSRLETAHRALSIDIKGEEGAALLDAIDIETLTNQMMLGEGDSPSAVARILDRAMRPGALNRVDPQRFILTATRSAAWTAVRGRVGDPHAGSKIRKISRELETENLEDIAAEYSRRYPRQDGVGAVRVGAALGVTRVPSIFTIDPQKMTAHTQSGDLC